jgi:hypothetical protein
MICMINPYFGSNIIYLEQPKKIKILPNFLYIPPPLQHDGVHPAGYLSDNSHGATIALALERH